MNLGQFLRSGGGVLLTSIGAAFAAALSGAGCGAKLDIHETQEAKTNDCLHCHTSAFQAAINPKHVGTFPETCDDCHQTGGAWVPIPDLHELEAIASQECVGCHQDEYDRTTKPEHAKRNFPTDCKDCHSTEKYAPLPKDIHGTKTFTQKTCFDCHQANYEATTNPNHVTANFPKTCEGCHTTGGAWVPTKTGG